MYYQTFIVYIFHADEMHALFVPPTSQLGHESTANLHPHEYKAAKDVLKYRRKSDFLFSFILLLADVSRSSIMGGPWGPDPGGPPRRNQHQRCYNALLYWGSSPRPDEREMSTRLHGKKLN